MVMLAEDLVSKFQSSQLNDLLSRKFPCHPVKLLIDKSNHVANLHVEQCLQLISYRLLAIKNRLP